MCGVIGAFGPSAKGLSDKIQSELLKIEHRGPDAKGFWVSPKGNCVLGHVRLSILDIDPRSNQPMSFSSEKALVYNGEIYNHEKLRAGGTSFVTTSDTETLYKLLESSADLSCLEKLSGMFAGAFFRNNQLYLFRDSLGIKPLYVGYLADGTVVFGSELRSVIALREESPRVNHQTLSYYCEYTNWPQGQSFFKGIDLISPGSILHFEDLGDQLKKVHKKFDYRELNTSYNGSLTEKIRGVVEQSVDQHLLSDVPVATYLSGGLDSGIVTALSRREFSSLTSFTGYFDGLGDFFDERREARALAKHHDVNLIEVPIGPADFEKEFDNLIYHLEEPRMGMGSFSQFVVAKEVKKHFKVILSGHGGDELFAGYRIFKAFALMEERGLKGRWQRLSQLSGVDWVWMAYVFYNYFMSQRLQFAPRLFPELAKNLKESDRSDGKSLFWMKSGEQSGVSDLMTYYRDVYLPGLLAVEDKVSMAHSLETRIPLWSQEILLQMKNVPIEEHLRSGELKHQLKLAFKDMIPESVLKAPKRGFPTPLKDWFRADLFDFVHQRLLGQQNSPIFDLISRKEVSKLLNLHKNTKNTSYAFDERRAQKIWILLSLESWFRQFRASL